MGLLLGLEAGEMGLIVLCCALVLSLELANTALEELADIVSAAHDARIGRIKDLMAGAVLVASCGAALVGCLVFGKALARLLGMR